MRMPRSVSRLELLSAGSRDAAGLGKGLSCSATGELCLPLTGRPPFDPTIRTTSVHAIGHTIYCRRSGRKPQQVVFERPAGGVVRRGFWLVPHLSLLLPSGARPL